MVNYNTRHSTLPNPYLAINGRAIFCIVFFLIFSAVVPAFGQSEYSDAYTVDSSNNSYDPDTDTYVMGDNVPPLDLVGVGVSEANYDSSVYSTSTTTTITSPSGVNTVTNSSSGFTYAVSEAFSLPLDPETAEEGDYQISSEHIYYRNSCYTPRDQTPMPCSPEMASRLLKFPLSPFRNASYKLPSILDPAGSISPKSAAGFSFFSVGVRTFFNGYELVGPGYARCSVHRYTPYGYRNFCDINTPCQKASVCGTGQASGIQVVSLRVKFFGFSACYNKGFYTPARPRCSPPAY